MQYTPTTKNIKEIKPTISSFSINITYPKTMQNNPILNGNFQESP